MYQGSSAPLVVKIADTEKDKNAKRLQSMVNNIGALGAVNPLQAAAYYQVCQAISLPPLYLSLSHSLSLSLLLILSLSHSLSTLFYWLFLNLFQLLHAGAATANNSFGLGTQLGNSKPLIIVVLILTTLYHTPTYLQ